MIMNKSNVEEGDDTVARCSPCAHCTVQALSMRYNKAGSVFEYSLHNNKLFTTAYRILFLFLISYYTTSPLQLIIF